MNTAVAMQLSLFNHLPVPGETAMVAVADREPTPAQQRRGQRVAAIHAHSLEARDAHQVNHETRAARIVRYIASAGKPKTDRNILEALFNGSDDMNLVRPRINDLLKEGKLMVAGETTDHRTGEMVRMVWLAK